MKTHIRVLPTSMCTYNVGTIIENKQHCSLLTLTHTLSLSQTRTSQTPIQTLSLSQLPIPTSQTHKQSLYHQLIHPKHTNSLSITNSYIPNTQTVSLSHSHTSQTHKQSLYRIPIHPKHTFTNSQRKAHKYICIQPNSNRTMQTYTHKASIRLPT